MRRLPEAPFCGLAPRHLLGPPTPLHENRQSFPRESVAPLPIRAAIACLKSIALPKHRALLATICLRDNRKAYRDSFRRLGKRAARRSRIQSGKIDGVVRTVGYIGCDFLLGFDCIA